MFWIPEEDRTKKCFGYVKKIEQKNVEDTRRKENKKMFSIRGEQKRWRSEKFCLIQEQEIQADWDIFLQITESIGIMGVKLRAPVKRLNTIVP